MERTAHPRTDRGCNFTRLGRDPQFRAAFGNTIFYWVTGVLVIPIAIAIAVVLNSPRLKAAPLVKTIFFLPYVTATIAIGLVFRILFDAQAGTLNAYLGLFGIEPVGWLTSTGLAKIPVAILFIWRHLPWYALIILSGLMVIPKDYYEAARIDGANAWRQFWHITLPSLRPILVFAFINLTVDSWNIFAEPYILPGPGTSTVAVPVPVRERVLAVPVRVCVLDRPGAGRGAGLGLGHPVPDLPPHRGDAVMTAAKVSSRPSRRRFGGGIHGSIANSFAVNGFALLMCVIALFPVLYMVLVALRPTDRPITGLTLFTDPAFTVENFGKAANAMPLWSSLANSAFTTVIGTVTTLFFCSLAGFAFAKFRFRGRNVLFVLILLTMLIPAEIGVVPLFVIMRDRLAQPVVADHPADGDRGRHLLYAAVHLNGAGRDDRGSPHRRGVQLQDLLVDHLAGDQAGARHLGHAYRAG